MEKRKHLINFHIAGFTYYDGCLVFDQLKIGSQLTMKREKENGYDPDAIAIYFDEFKLGFIPKDENFVICKFLDMGYENSFELRCNQLNHEAHTEHQVGCILYLLPNR